MKNAIQSSARQSILSVQFAIGSLAVAIIMFLASTSAIVEAFRSEEPLYSGYHDQFIINAMSSNAMLFCVPIICTLPFTASYVDDLKSNFVRYYISRSSRGGYIAAKITGCAVSGGAVLVCGIFLAYLAATLIFVPMEAPLAEGTSRFALLPQILSQCGFVFLSGALWALVGMLISTMMESKYIAYASPFVIYYVLIILHERYLNSIFVIYPREWILPTENWVLGKWGVAILVAELIVFTSVLFSVRADRRLRQL